MKWILRVVGVLFLGAAALSLLYANSHYHNAVFCDEQIHKGQADDFAGLLGSWALIRYDHLRRYSAG